MKVHSLAMFTFLDLNTITKIKIKYTVKFKMKPHFTLNML